MLYASHLPSLLPPTSPSFSLLLFNLILLLLHFLFFLFILLLHPHHPCSQLSIFSQVFLSLVQGTNLIQRLINVAYTYDNLAHRWGKQCNTVKV